MITSLGLPYLTGLVQVFLVSFQVRQIAGRAKLWQIAVTGCAISAVWVLNVRAAVEGVWPAFFYVLGAGTGTLLAQLVPLGRKRDEVARDGHPAKTTGAENESP